MPGEETPLDPACSQQQLLRHYIPVLTRSVAPPERSDTTTTLSSLRRPAGVSLNVHALPEIYGEHDGILHDSELLMQLSPASATQLGLGGASPTSLSALSALRHFLPSNFDGVDALQYDMYSGDEFRMYEFKVRRCMRGRSHDWTQCPFAHPGEKARRRDPRRYHYSGTACADYKKGSCKKGDACDLAHGVFESWLHPTRYRTQPCKDGQSCQRRVCFFAHTRDQLRVGSPTTSSPSTSPSASFLYSGSTEARLEASDLSGPLSPGASRILLNSSLSESPPVSSSQLPMLSNAGISTASSLSPRSLAFDLFPHVAASRLSPCQSPKDLARHSGISTFMLPTPSSMDFSQSLQSNHMHAPMASHNFMFSQGQNVSVSLSTTNGSNMAVASPSSSLSLASHTSHNIEDLVGLLKQVGLAQDEGPVWQEDGRLSGAPERTLLLGYAPRLPAGPTYMRCRGSEEMILNGDFVDEDEDRSEPRLERVESGRGLRAQIFESLISSASASGF